MLKALKKIAEQRCGKPIEKAVVTVPAFFNTTQKQATIDACELAGLKCLRLISEPTSAAIAYEYHEVEEDAQEKNVLIFDLGGGTFDVTVLTASAGSIGVEATTGDAKLGGREIDELLVEEIV